jgi:hypothetical protein
MPLKANHTRKASHARVTKAAMVARRTNVVREELSAPEGSGSIAVGFAFSALRSFSTSLSQAASSSFVMQPSSMGSSMLLEGGCQERDKGLEPLLARRRSTSTSRGGVYRSQCGRRRACGAVH